MDAISVRAVLARTPALHGGHVQALAAAAAGDLTRALDLDVLSATDLPPEARTQLARPDPTLLEADLEWLQASGAHVFASTDEQYPDQLRSLTRPPAVLFVLGDPQALSASQLAIVGARKASRAGCETAREFAAYLARAGLIITSGLALGIDAASHEGALAAGGRTVAVCATGLDRIYPTQHAGLAARIREHGALLSEFPRGTAPRPFNFRQRNRLISGLSRGVLVVEAAQHSGSLITARRAAEQGREVFAIPGSRHDPGVRGCHQLIRAGADLVDEPVQVLSKLKFSLTDEGLVRREPRPRIPGALDKGYEMLLDAVGFEPATIDIIGVRTGFSGATIASMLLVLELEGRIAPYPGGRYGRIP